jgi:hypothetical protein
MAALHNSTQRHGDQDPAEWKRIRCSFCGRNGDQVRFLSAGVAGGMICDACCLQAFFIFIKAHVVALFRRAAA